MTDLAKQVNCAKCGACIQGAMLTCKYCGEPLIDLHKDSIKVPDRFTTSLIEGLRDNFNPAMRSVEDIFTKATRDKRKK